MELYWKGIALSLISAVLHLVVSRQQKDTAAMLLMAACCAVAVTAAVYLRPVLTLMWQLQSQSGMEPETVRILLRIVGIALVSQLGDMLCCDAGASSLGKMVKILSLCAMLHQSVPLVQSLMTLIGDILGGL